MAKSCGLPNCLCALRCVPCAGASQASTSAPARQVLSKPPQAAPSRPSMAYVCETSAQRARTKQQQQAGYALQYCGIHLPFSKSSGKAGRVNVGMRGWCFVFDHGRRYIAFGVLMPFAVLVAGAKHRIGEAESWGQRQTGFPLSPILPCTMSSAAFRASAAVTVVSAVCISCVASSGHGPSTRMTPYSLNTASSCCAHLACSASLCWPRPGSRRTATCRWLPSRAPNQDPLITSTTRILGGRTAPFSRLPYS